MHEFLRDIQIQIKYDPADRYCVDVDAREWEWTWSRVYADAHRNGVVIGVRYEVATMMYGRRCESHADLKKCEQTCYPSKV
jgi:hypothetical protein